MAFKASHSLFNYSNLIFLQHGVLPNKELLVLMYESVEKNDSNFIVFMEAISAGLLASCLSNGIKCRSLLVPASNVPDPEGAAILIEAVNSLRQHLLNIDVRLLRVKREIVIKQMDDLIKVMLTQQQQQDQLGTGRQGMYTQSLVPITSIS